MNNNRITFIGSSQQKSARNTENGECHRIVNLRQQSNSLTSVGNNPIDFVLADTSRILLYVHTCNEQQHFISQSLQTLYHESDNSTIDGTRTNVNKVIITLDEELCSITSIGTTLIATTSSKIYYIIYREGGYKILGNHPPMPIIRLEDNIDNRWGKYLSRISYTGKVDKSNTEAIKSLNNTIMSTFYELREKAYKNNYFAQPIVARYALRLYDGSHILPSPPIALCTLSYSETALSRKANFVYHPDYDITNMDTIDIMVTGFNLRYTIEDYQLDDWRDIVTGIDIFVSKEIPLIKDGDIDGEFTLDEGNNTTYQFTLPLTGKSFVEKSACEETLFYKFTSIDLNSIEIGATKDIENEIRPEDIIYEPRLEVDTSGFYHIGAQKSFAYNGRLHLADITRQLYEGYPINLFINSYDNDANPAMTYIRTTIANANGSVSEVLTYAKIPFFNYTLSALLSYPDSNATSMKIAIRHDGHEYSKTFALRSIGNENRATYVNSQLSNINVMDWYCKDVTPNNVEDFPTKSQTCTRQSRNEMIVSELNNPFFFPSELTFNISNGIIVGIATTTIALSQGQYGEFPLYIFTNEGIWSMQLGDGNICYNRCNLINNANVDKSMPTITTERSIIYRAGNNLYYLNGSDSNILLPLTSMKEQYFESCIPALLGNTNSAFIDKTSLADYLSGDISMGYIDMYNELIICNPAYKYCIVLGLQSGHIYRKECSIRRIVQSGNRLWAQSSNNAIYDIGKENNSMSTMCLISQPIQLIPDAYARVQQIVLRMSCSNANITMKVIAAHEPDGTYNNIYTASYNGTIAGHLPLRLLAPGYKHFRIIIYGTVSHDFILDCADIMFEPVNVNKLR